MPARINPSILSADFVNFERDFGTIANSDLIHVDVMDNNFVPNLTFGLPMVARMQQIAPKPLDVHLMIANVDKWAPGYAETGAYSVTFHAEASENPVALARAIRAIGARAGVALKPGTDVEPFLDLLSEFDQLLVMTVEPFLSTGGHWATEGADGWTLYAEPNAPVVQYEHTVVATDRGAIVVTLPG